MNAQSTFPVDGVAASVMVPLPGELRRGAGDEDIAIAGRRLGRVLFGAALCVGAVVTVYAASAFSRGEAVREGGLSAPSIFATTWLAAVCAYLVGRVVGAVVQRRRGVCADETLLFPSLALPMVGMSLLLPLSLHGLIGLLLGDPEGFEEWVRISLVIVGHVHVLLAAMCVRAAWRMSRGEPHLSGVLMLFIGTFVACLPGVVLLALPPLIVLATGAVFVPLMLSVTSRIADDEIRKTGAVP